MLRRALAVLALAWPCVAQDAPLPEAFRFTLRASGELSLDGCPFASEVEAEFDLTLRRDRDRPGRVEIACPRCDSVSRNCDSRDATTRAAVCRTRRDSNRAGPSCWQEADDSGRSSGSGSLDFELRRLER